MNNNSSKDKRTMSDLEQRISYKFKDKSLLEIAMTHPSYRMQVKHGNGEDNQRLEFLGDAVLELCVSKHLYMEYPDKDEGWMTKARSLMVRENTLFEVAKKIGLGQSILLSPSEEKNGGREKPSILSDAVEALLAALYLDGGFYCADEFITKNIPSVDGDEELSIKDPKTMLQEILQKDGQVEIKYKIIEEHGEAHDKVFVSAIMINGKKYGSGKGKSKKEAEQEAALLALSKIKH